MGWDDEGEEDWDLEALAAIEAQAMAQRQHAHHQKHERQQTTAGAAGRPQGPTPATAACAAGLQQLDVCGGRPPVTARDLCQRVCQFAKRPPPALRPPHDSCPGVYGCGCGGILQLVSWADGAIYFWACSSTSCAYRAYPPLRKLSPELCITLDRHRSALEVAPMPGAEDAVRYCGGVAAVLGAAGVDIRRALSLPAAPNQSGPISGHKAAAADAQPVGAVAMVPKSTGNETMGAGTVGAAARQAEGIACQSSVPSMAIGGAGEVSNSAAHSAGLSASNAPASSASLQPVVFPLHEYEHLSNHLVQFGRMSGVMLLPSAGMIPLPTMKAARGMWRALPSASEVEAVYARMPSFLEDALLPFQREGVLFGLSRNGRCLLADEMGVGKTVQAIALASCFQDEWPLLITVPASLRLVWAEELEKWLPHLRPSSIHVIEGKEDRVARGGLPLVCITSYEMMQRLTCDACKGRVIQHTSMCAGQRPPCKDLQNCMASQRWKVVIVDESHTLRTCSKPPDALHTEAVVSAVKLAQRAILLTGTPSLSRPYDLFRQVDALMPGLLGPNRIAFAAAYCNRREVPLVLPGGERRTKWDVGGLARGRELHDMLKAEVMMRRLKKDVLSQLPPKRRQVIRLPKPPASEWPKLAQGAKRHADDSEGSASSGSDDEGDEEVAEDGSGGSRPPKPMSSAHRTGLAKASSVIDWLMTALGARRSKGQQDDAAQQAEDEDAADGVHPSSSGGTSDPGGPKCLVFAHHTTVMNRLAAALEGAKQYAPVGYVRIDGSTDPEDRRQAVRRFHSDPAARVALLSVTAAGVGLDFSAASVVVFAELPNELAHVRQAEDRAHRQGQRHPVNVYFLCAKGTTDDRRWQALNRSLARVAAVHDGAGLPAAAPACSGDGGKASSTAEGDGEDSKAAGPMVASTQAGLLVECVHDADEAGLTPVATKAGWGAARAQPPGNFGATTARRESLGGTQTGESPLLSAGAAAHRPVQVVANCAAAADEQGDLPAGSAEAAAGAPKKERAVTLPAQNAAIPAGNVPQAGRRLPSRGCRVAVLGAELGAAASRGSLRAAQPASGIDVLGQQAPPQLKMPASDVEVWFEVSGNTHRVHLHAAPDGSAPLRLSLPMEALLTGGGDSPQLEELLQAVEQASSQQQQQQQQKQQEQQQGQKQGPQGGVPPPVGHGVRPGPQAVATADCEQQGQQPAHSMAVGQPERMQTAPSGAVQRAQGAANEGLQQAQRTVVISGIGVLALDSQVSAVQLSSMLAEAREFAAEWRELRGLYQSRLHGKFLRLPLHEAVEEIEKAAATAGRMGTSTARFVLAQRADLPLPCGAEWRTVRVTFKRYACERQYQQPFLPSGARLCINCAKPVLGPAAAQPAEAVLDGMTNLFCSGECEGWFSLKSNGSAYRRALFKLERGVCVNCRLDCHTLVKRLQAVEKGSRGWEKERLRIIQHRAPRLTKHGYKSYLDQLVKRAVEGNAWQADHIVPVYKGGGLCDVDNLRTLCVACHADVTKQQTKERAATRQQKKAAKGKAGGKAGAGAGSGWQDLADAEDGSGGSSGEEGGSKPVLKRRARLKRLICEDSEAEEQQQQLQQEEMPADALLTKPVAPATSKQGAALAAKGRSAGGGKAGASRVVRRRANRLNPLLSESDDAEQLVQSRAAAPADGPTAPPAAAAQLHRLACSSTASVAAPEQQAALGPAAPSAAAAAGIVDKQPLTSGAANSQLRSQGGNVSKKRSHGAVAPRHAPRSSSKVAKLAPHARTTGRLHVDGHDLEG